eukprot:TRINITY_DN24518_c0_g1_i1.p1 TRINITY_DN24518_c0_g1~~TRINITY_DN24518_c0_g1_i1.p1  ORF type:complete len:462 (+),score=102.43 TRINITY_DN24518_c0_g1_i1:62-1447(+)
MSDEDIEAFSQGKEYTVESVKQMILDEDENYAKQVPEMLEVLEAKRDEVVKLLQQVKEQEKKLAGVNKDIGNTRGGIDKKRAKGESTENMDELKKNATQALPVFVQTLTQYNLADEERRANPSSTSKLKFWKKPSSPEASPDQKDGPRHLYLNLEIPNGVHGPCKNPASGFAIALTCKEPKKSLEELAEEGGSVTLVFALREGGTGTEEVVDSAKKYFEEWFASRAKEEGATPDIDIKVTESTLVVTARLSVTRDKVGGLLGRLESVASGEFLGKDNVLGKYTEDQVKDALSQLRHTRLTGNFNSDVGFEDMVKGGAVNWDFFDKVTGTGDLVLERCVYKAVQKVVDIFSTVAAAKMSIGGKFFRRLNFKVDGLIFKALKEDATLVTSLDQSIESLLGSSIKVTPDIMHHLQVLSSSIKYVRSAAVELPAVSLNLQFQNLDFFGIVNDAAKLALERQQEGK